MGGKIRTLVSPALVDVMMLERSGRVRIGSIVALMDPDMVVSEVQILVTKLPVIGPDTLCTSILVSGSGGCSVIDVRMLISPP